MAYRHDRKGFDLLGHPVHPMIIVFPLALLTAAVVLDIVYLIADDPFWGRAAFWSLTGGAGDRPGGGYLRPY